MVSERNQFDQSCTQAVEIMLIHPSSCWFAWWWITVAGAAESRLQRFSRKSIVRTLSPASTV